MEDQQQSLRTNVALAMIILMMVGFMWWSGGFSGGEPETAAPDAGAVLMATADAGPTAGVTAPPQLMAAAAGDGGVADGGEALARAEAPPPELRVLERSRASVHYLWSNAGGGLVSAELQGKKMREQGQLSIAEGYKRLFGGLVPEPPQMNVAQPVPGAAVPLALTVIGGGGAVLVPPDLRYEALGDGPESQSVAFRGTANGLEVTKRFEWEKDGFELRYQLELRNVSGQPLAGEYALEYSRAIDPRFEEAPSFFGGVGNQSRVACLVGDDLNAMTPGDEPKTEEHKGALSFIGIDQQYFLSAIFPIGGAKQGRCVTAASPTVRRAVAYFPLSLQPGQAVTESFGVYLGPKDVEQLALVPSSKPGLAAPAPTAFRPQLERTVDFGIWAVLCKFLLWVLKFFHTVFGNWGVAVILLTVVVKLVLVPLTHKSMVAAENMKKLQPKMEEIRKKFAEDKERQNMELMKLYQEAKVNPFGGCLPLLLQMPVWIALFTTLRNSYEIYQEPFVAPMFMDLTYKDPTYLLPVLLGVTMIITQKLQPQMMDAAQAKIMTWVMPIFFTAIMLNYPAGLTLYIFTNNVLSIAQQWGLKKWIARKAPAPA